MTPTKPVRYGKLSSRAGMVCSCCVVVLFAGLFCNMIFPDLSPGLLAFMIGLSIFGALSSGVTCIAAAIFGRRNRSEKTDENHEKDAA
jgi:hypothetical protein